MPQNVYTENILSWSFYVYWVVSIKLEKVIKYEAYKIQSLNVELSPTKNRRVKYTLLKMNTISSKLEICISVFKAY